MVKATKTKKPTKAEQEKMLRDYLAQILSKIAPGVEIGETSMDIALQIDNATTIIPRLEKKVAEFDRAISDVVEDNMDLQTEIADLKRSNYIYRATGYDAEMDALAICDHAISDLIPLDEDDDKPVYGSLLTGNRAARYRIIEFLTAKYGVRR